MKKEKVVIEKELMDYENLVSFRCLDPDNHKIEVYLE